MYIIHNMYIYLYITYIYIYTHILLSAVPIWGQFRSKFTKKNIHTFFYIPLTSPFYSDLRWFTTKKRPPSFGQVRRPRGPPMRFADMESLRCRGSDGFDQKNMSLD